MKAVYRVDLAGDGPDPAFAQPVTDNSMKIGDVTIAVVTDEQTGRLIEVEFSVANLPIVRDPATDSILPPSADIEAQVFATASLLNNMLRIHTGVDVINPFRVVGNSPDNIPETPEEEREFQGSRFTRMRSVPISFAVRELISPAEWQQWGSNASNQRFQEAVANFADGVRALSPFLRFEQFYKVFEHFFPKLDSEKLDRAVSAHLSGLDPSVTEAEITALRHLRIRSVHPQRRPTRPHLSPQRISDVKELNAALPRLQQLARLMLQHPPE